MVTVEQLDEFRWRIPRHGGMHVDGVVYADESLMAAIREDQSLQQVANVAHLPGIVGASLAMPDIHWGYGFPIGGVAAMDAEDGVVSPGGVGYDINCGVRLVASGLTRADVTPRLREIVKAMYARVPTGVGASRRDFRLSKAEIKGVLEGGAAWAIERGFGTPDELQYIEDGGVLPGAAAGLVSERAIERGQLQLGTLGSGNHFAELQYVAEIYDATTAAAFGLARDQVTVMIHSGSRGLGHQVCDDHLRVMIRAAQKYGIDLPDRQLCCAPLRSSEGREYLAAMSAAANFAFANRQVMAHWVRAALADAMGITPDDTRTRTVYDVCHNIAKFETFPQGSVCVHRKGATRAYPPHHPQTPPTYRNVGQPVLIPGDMGRYSYVLAGTQHAFNTTFGSSCHGAGRRWSRGHARRQATGHAVIKDLASRGVVVMAAGVGTVAEEMPDAYKDVADVVRVVHGAGIARQVAQLRPIGVIKG